MKLSSAFALVITVAMNPASANTVCSFTTNSTVLSAYGKVLSYSGRTLDEAKRRFYVDCLAMVAEQWGQAENTPKVSLQCEYFTMSLACEQE